MTNDTNSTKRAEELLGEALDLLNDAPRFTMRHDRTKDSYGLASRISAHKRELAEAEALPIILMSDQPPTCGDCGRRIELAALPCAKDEDGDIYEGTCPEHGTRRYQDDPEDAAEHEERMSAADLAPADWLAIQNAVSNDGDLSNAKRIRLVDRLGDFHASAEEARANRRR